MERLSRASGLPLGEAKGIFAYQHRGNKRPRFAAEYRTSEEPRSES